MSTHTHTHTSTHTVPRGADQHAGVAGAAGPSLWLRRADGSAVRCCPAEVADTRAARRRGLLGRRHLDGVLVLKPCRSVHTIGMAMPIDVAHVRRDGLVLRVVTMPPQRLGRPVVRAHLVIEAAAGAFREWGIAAGTRVEVR